MVPGTFHKCLLCNYEICLKTYLHKTKTSTFQCNFIIFSHCDNKRQKKISRLIFKLMNEMIYNIFIIKK